MSAVWLDTEQLAGEVHQALNDAGYDGPIIEAAASETDPFVLVYVVENIPEAEERAALESAQAALAAAGFAFVTDPAILALWVTGRIGAAA